MFIVPCVDVLDITMEGTVPNNLLFFPLLFLKIQQKLKLVNFYG